MSFRVAFDLDGTIANMQAVLRVEAERLFGETPPSTPATDDGDRMTAQPEAKELQSGRELTSRQQSELWAHVSAIDNFWETLPEMEDGIVARLASVAHSRRWEVIFITTRPPVAGDTVQTQTQRWLAAHGFTLPSVFVVQHSRGKIADALDLDAFVDDRSENSLDVALDSKAIPILIWPDDQKEPPAGAKRMGVRVVQSVSDALNLVVQIDAAKNDRGVVRSIKKLFGKETTA